MNDFTTDFTWMIKHFCYSVDDLNKQESENGNTKKKVAVTEDFERFQTDFTRKKR